MPAPGTNRVGDQLHRPELFGRVDDERRDAVKDGGSIVVAVGVGCEGEYEAVNL